MTGTSLRVLVVEDSEDDAELVLREMRGGGYEVVSMRVDTPESMAEALDTRPWDIVVSDHGMPAFSAPQALLLLRKRELDIPFVIVSGSIGEETAVAVMKAGASDYLLKGNLKRLPAVVERELREAAERRARRDAERRQHEAEENYRILVEEIPAVTYIAALEEPFPMKYISPQVESLTGFPPAKWSAQPDLWMRQLHPEDRERVLGELRNSKATGERFIADYRFLTREGKVQWWHDHARIVRDGEGRAALLRGFVMDITDRVAAEEMIRHSAYHDRLTDLPNRTLLEHHVREGIVDARRQHRPLALLMLNVNSFTEITSTLGHRNGDLVITQLAWRLKGLLEEGDTLARTGGDTFAVMLGRADAQRATETARRILKELEEPFSMAGLPIELEGTVGIALFPGHGEEVDLLIQHAEVAVHLARRERSGVSLYTAEKDPYNPRRLQLMGELRRGIEGDQLFLQYQPKVSLSTARVVGTEALVRWRHPTLGMVPPVQFIPMAEQSGLIKPLTGWVLNEALRQCREWRKQGLDLNVAVNLSTRNLHDPQLPEEIGGLLETWGVPAARLELEITESALLTDNPLPLEVLHRLRTLGMKIAIDDFGTGYSSLGYLRSLPASDMKIDKSFVSRMTTNREDETIVRSTIELGHNLGLTIIAEGVEDQETLERLENLGCDVVQGYHTGAPMGETGLSKWLRESPWGVKQDTGPQIRELEGTTLRARSLD